MDNKSVKQLTNICIFTNTLFSGGAEKQAVLLAKALNEKYNVWLVVYYGNKVEQKFQTIIDENQIQTVYLKGNNFKKIRLFYSFLKDNKINIIFSYLLTTNLIGGVIGKFAGIKNTIGGIRSSKLSSKKEWLQRIIQNYINKKTIYNNNKGFEVLSVKGFNSKKAAVIPNCFEINTKEIRRGRKSKITIISVGRFHEAKDYATAIKAMSFLKQHQVNFKYQIIGYGKEEGNIRDWIRKYGFSEIVEVIINPDNINDYYKNADIYLMTSIFEGLSNTVLEAMSFSLPLVLTNVGDNNRLVVEGKNGNLCKVGDYKTIAVKLESIIAHYDKRIEFGIKSYQILTKNYSFEKFQQNYFHLIENLEK